MIKWLLFILLTTNLFAVEGNEPVPLLELPPPTVHEETLKITSPLIFPRLFIGIDGGKSEIGKNYKAGFNYYPDINKALDANWLNIEDKTAIIGGIEFRHIGSYGIAEIDMRGGTYKIDKDWNKVIVANSLVNLYLGENVIKLFNSGCYEFEPIWDCGVLWGRNLGESVFAGLGVSGPRYIAPFVQINWVVNPSLSINISHRSKEVTTTFDSLYMNQPYVIQNPDLKHERWNSLFTIKFLFRNNMVIEIAHKGIEDIICFLQTDKVVKPTNFGQQREWIGKMNFAWWKIENVLVLKHRPAILAFYVPKSLFAHSLEITLPHDIRIGFGDQYVGERCELFEGSDLVGRLPAYWLFSFKLSKKLSNWELWGRINNLTNTKYEIIKGVEGPGTSFQAGVELTVF